MIAGWITRATYGNAHVTIKKKRTGAHESPRCSSQRTLSDYFTEAMWTIRSTTLLE